MKDFFIFFSDWEKLLFDYIRVEVTGTRSFQCKVQNEQNSIKENREADVLKQAGGEE